MGKRLFSAPNGDIRVSLTNGQAATITKEPRELPECMWAEAYAKGAISGGMTSSSKEDIIENKKIELQAKEEREKERLTSILKDIYSNPIGNLDSNNQPLVRKVSAKFGKPVRKSDILGIWESLTAED